MSTEGSGDDGGDGGAVGSQTAESRKRAHRERQSQVGFIFLFFYTRSHGVNGERLRFFFFLEGTIAERSLAATTKKIEQIRRAFSRHDKKKDTQIINVLLSHTERQRERRMKREELRKPRRTTMWTSIRSIAIRKKS